jgi:hypothetical protein
MSNYDDTERVSFRISDTQLLADFDAWLRQDSTPWGNRSAALRGLMRRAVEQDTDVPSDGRQPPVESDLADAYSAARTLTRMRGAVPEDALLSHLASELGKGKETVKECYVIPLVERGYIKRSGNIYGETRVRARL